MMCFLLTHFSAFGELVHAVNIDEAETLWRSLLCMGFVIVPPVVLVTTFEPFHLLEVTFGVITSLK